MSEDIFMLYQKEIDALVKRGYKDAFEWLKEAAVKFPEATIEELLAAANSLIKPTEVFTEADTTDVSELSIPAHKHVTKATINKVKNKGVDSFWESKKEVEKKRHILHPERIFEAEPVEVVNVVDLELEEMSPEDAPIFFATKQAIVDKSSATEYIKLAEELEAGIAAEAKSVENLEFAAAKARLEIAKAEHDNIVERRINIEREIVQAEAEVIKAALPENAKIVEIYEDEPAVITIKNKEYIAPAEMTVDNSVQAEYVIKKKRRLNLKGKTEEASIGVSDTVNEFSPAPEKTRERSGIGSSESSQAVEGAEVIELEDNIIEGDVSLTIKNKEYVAPADMTVDNSIKAEYVVTKKAKPVKTKRSFFKREKIEEGTIGVSDSAELEPIAPILAVSMDIQRDENTIYLDESEKAWDSEITGKLTEKTLASEATVKIKDKEYVAPPELIIDNTLPEIEKSENVEPVVVEISDKVIESPANLILKNKKYVAPADMTIDNSLSPSISEGSNAIAKPKRPVFRKRSKETEEVKVVYLPAKPIDKSFVAEPRAEHIEGMPVYRPKKKEISTFIDENIAIAVAADINSAQSQKNADEEAVEDSFSPDIELPYVDEGFDVKLPPKPIDFSAIAKEIELERAAAVEAELLEVNEYTEEEALVEEDIEEEYAAELSEKAKKDDGKNKLANRNIIKDIKSIDSIDF